MEWRADRGERFGRGQEKPMKFGDFLSELEEGSELLYLTTQVRDWEGSYLTPRVVRRRFFCSFFLGCDETLIDSTSLIGGDWLVFCQVAGYLVR